MSKTPQTDGAVRYCRQSIPKAHWLKHIQTICRAFEEENTALRAHAERLAETLEKIQRRLNLDDEESYASDDPQGAIDSAHADATAALTLYRAENPKV